MRFPVLPGEAETSSEQPLLVRCIFHFWALVDLSLKEESEKGDWSWTGLRVSVSLERPHILLFFHSKIIQKQK